MPLGANHNTQKVAANYLGKNTEASARSTTYIMVTTAHASRCCLMPAINNPTLALLLGMYDMLAQLGVASLHWRVV